jgi:hypothetical protein
VLAAAGLDTHRLSDQQAPVAAQTRPFGRQLDIRYMWSPPEVLAAAHTHTPPFGQQGLDSVEGQDTVPGAEAEAPELDHTERKAVRSEALHGWGHIRPSLCLFRSGQPRSATRYRGKVDLTCPVFVAIPLVRLGAPEDEPKGVLCESESILGSNWDRTRAHEAPREVS